MGSGNPISAVTKVFKSVTKSAVGKIVVAAAVAYFTAGLGAGVLGATGLAGSLSPAMTTVLSHAISGAIAGGITSGITGGNVLKGMALGGLGGAAVGGVQSALGNFTTIPGQAAGAATDAASAVGGEAVGAAGDAAASTLDVGVDAASGSILNSNAPISVADLPAPSMLDSHAAANLAAETGAASVAPGAIDVGTHVLPPSAAPVTAATQVAAAGAQNAAAAPTSNGLLAKIGTWAADNPGAAAAAGGVAMSGLGQGLMAKGAADAEMETAEAKIKAEQERAANIQASHSGNGLLTPEGNTLNTDARPTPSQRFDPRAYGGQWVYDPNVPGLVWVPNQAA